MTGPLTERSARVAAARRLTRRAGRDAAGLSLAEGRQAVAEALADPAGTPELFAIRQQASRWRFYDHFRTDAGADARRPGIATFTPVLAPGGDDLRLNDIQVVGTHNSYHLQGEPEVFAALRAGAVGYLLKDVSGDRLVEAVLAAARGESVLQPSVAAKVPS